MNGKTYAYLDLAAARPWAPVLLDPPAFVSGRRQRHPLGQCGGAGVLRRRPGWALLGAATRRRGARRLASSPGSSSCCRPDQRARGSASIRRGGRLNAARACRRLNLADGTRGARHRDGRCAHGIARGAGRAARRRHRRARRVWSPCCRGWARARRLRGFAETCARHRRPSDALVDLEQRRGNIQRPFETSEGRRASADRPLARRLPTRPGSQARANHRFDPAHMAAPRLAPSPARIVGRPMSGNPSAATTPAPSEQAVRPRVRSRRCSLHRSQVQTDPSAAPSAYPRRRIETAAVAGLRPQTSSLPPPPPKSPAVTAATAVPPPAHVQRPQRPAPSIRFFWQMDPDQFFTFTLARTRWR